MVRAASSKVVATAAMEETEEMEVTEEMVDNRAAGTMVASLHRVTATEPSRRQATAEVTVANLPTATDSELRLPQALTEALAATEEDKEVTEDPATEEDKEATVAPTDRGPATATATATATNPPLPLRPPLTEERNRSEFKKNKKKRTQLALK